MMATEGAPVVQSARLDRMREVLDKVLDAIVVKAVTEDDVRSCFAGALQLSSKLRDDHMRVVRDKLFMGEVRNNIKLEFEDICVECDMPQKLKRLERLTEQQKAVHARPKVLDVDPEELVSAALCKTKQARRDQLAERLAALKAENASLRIVLSEKSDEEKALKAKADVIFGPIEAAKGICVNVSKNAT